MKKLNEILNALDISKIRAYYTLIFGDFADLVALFVDAFTKLLGKAPPSKLLFYADLARKIAKLIRYVVDEFVETSRYRDAAMKTALAVESLSEHIKDGKYEPVEFSDDMANIKIAAAAWVNLKQEDQK